MSQLQLWQVIFLVLLALVVVVRIRERGLIEGILGSIVPALGLFLVTGVLGGILALLGHLGTEMEQQDNDPAQDSGTFHDSLPAAPGQQ